MSVRNKVISLYESFNFFFRLYLYFKIVILKVETYIQYLPKTGTIVDVGCGYGLVANYLSLILPDSKVIGIDIDANRIKVASTTVGDRKNILFVNADAVNWFVREKCSMMIMTDFLHHVSFDKQKIMLQRAYDNLQENGVLIISEVDASIKPAYKYWNSCLFDMVFYFLSAESCFSKSSDLFILLRDLGFEATFYFPRSYIFAEIVYVCRKKI